MVKYYLEKILNAFIKKEEMRQMLIREIKTIAELEQVQQLELNVWGLSPLPVSQTLTAVKNGGIVVGAYEGDTLVGFSYGFPGFKNGKPYLCSHMLGIASHCRAQGIGELLKQKQRNIAIERGYDKMLWTYDPLETRNGYLNLTKLNAVCDTYVENCYGEMQDGLNKGLPSDRLEVNWYLTSKYVAQKEYINTPNAHPIIEYITNSQGYPVLCEFHPNDVYDENAYLLPVPIDFQALKKNNPEVALDWRFKTRTIIQTLFAQGYVAIRLEKGQSMHHYVFMKKVLLNLT